MVYQLPPLSWLRAFEAAARLGSFTEAAGELRLTQSAISHQVRSLEKHLGYSLFDRLPRSLALTELGRAYLLPVRNSFSELSAVTSGLFSLKVERRLDVRVPASFAALWLAPRLSDFSTRHPDILVRLNSVIWSDALPSDDIDMDIRFGFGNWPGFSSELIIKDDCVVVSPPSSTATSPADILNEPRIHTMGYEETWMRFYQASGSDSQALHKPHIVTNTSISALELVAAGAGHAVALKIFAENYIRSGRVTRLPAFELPHDEAHFIVLPGGEQKPAPHVQMFRDWLLEEAGRYQRERQYPAG